MAREVAGALAGLEKQGWTLAAVADALGEKWLKVYRWRDGTAHPANPDSVLKRIEAISRLPRTRPADRSGRPAPER